MKTGSHAARSAVIVLQGPNHSGPCLITIIREISPDFNRKPLSSGP